LLEFSFGFINVACYFIIFLQPPPSHNPLFGTFYFFIVSKRTFWGS